MTVTSVTICILYMTALVTEGGVTWNGPTSEAVVVGSQMTMSCQPPVQFDSVDWYFIAFRSVEKSLISRGEKVFSNFKEFSVANESVSGQTLTLRSAEMKHAGIYACSAFLALTNGTGRTIEYTAHLTVLETVPECVMNRSIVFEGDYVDIKCAVRFRGSLVPSMHWMEHRADDGQGSLLKDGHSQTIVKDDTITSVARIAVDDRLNNCTYSCTLFFQALQSESSPVNASNAPVYNYTWKSPALQVYFGPKEVMILPRKSVYAAGEVLSCTAKSSPEPHFEWKNLETGEIVKGSELVIRSSMQSTQRHSFNCKARNDQTDRESTANALTFHVSSTNDGIVSLETVVLIAVPVSSVFSVLILALIIYIVHLKRRNKRIYMQSSARLRDPATTMTTHISNNDANYSEYSEIQSYNTCQEAMERSNHRAPSSSYNTAPADYLSMSSNTSHSIGQRDRLQQRRSMRNRGYQNNTYMEPDDDFTTRYSVILPSTKQDQTTPKNADCDLKERKNRSSLEYTPLNRSEDETGNQTGIQFYSNPGKEQDEEQSIYLEPISIS